jgi:hypothetical protein
MLQQRLTRNLYTGQTEPLTAPLSFDFTEDLGNKRNLSLLSQYGGAAAAYSLRALGSYNENVVRVRRASDNDEKDFTALQVNSGELTNWVNSQIVPPLDIGVLTSEGRIPVPEGGTSIGTPAAAYSLRNLSTTYTGNVVDVRRSSGGTESFTAAEVADGTLTDWVLAPVSSFIGNKMYFDRVNDYINLDSFISYTGDFTLTFSFIPDTLDGTIQPVVGNGNIDYIGVAQINGSDRIYVSTLAGSTQFIVLDSNFTEKAVNDVIISRSGSTITFTVNGDVQSTTLTYSTTIPISRIGARGIGVALLKGIITELDFGNGTTFDGTIADGNTIGTVNGSPELFTGQGFDGFVSKWYDQSGNDNHATQGTAASQPKIVDGGSLVSGGNKFDGTNDFLTFPDRFLSGSFAISTVFNLQNKDKTNNTLFGYSTNAGFIRYQVNRLGIKVSGGENFINLTLANNRDYVMSITRDASNLVSLYVDGSFIGSFTQSGQFSLDRIGVFAESSSYFLQGTMTETLIYNSDQSANRTAIEANIGETYGITGIPAYDNTVDGFVETWYDQSGNGNDATQSVAAFQPKIVDGGVLVSGGLDFDGVDDVLGTSLVPPNVATLIGVAEWDSLGASALTIIGSRDSSNQRSHLIQSAAGFVQMGVAAASITGSAITQNTTYLIFGSYNGSTRLLSTNGSAVTDELGTNPSNTTYGYSLGAIKTAGTNNFFMDGTLAEVIVYNSDQSANRVAIETNINAHYDIYP